MHIAIVTHNIVKGDGQGRVNYELARYLLDQEVEVDLFADRVAQELIDQGANWHPIHPGFDDLILLKVWRFKRLANQRLTATDQDYDIVLGCGVTLDCPHTHNAAHFVHGPWLESPHHAANVATGLQRWYQWLFTALNARWERSTFNKADEVIAVSEMVRDELIQIGVPSSKIEVIVNGVDLGEFAPGPADRSALGLPEDVVLGLFVGDLQSPIKNVDGVLCALADVPDVHLAIAGTIGQSPYPSLAQSLGIASRVHFLDFRRDVADLMRAADFFALPSRRDSCPLVLLEALASGLPAIVSGNVGTADLVRDGAGFVLDTPDDHHALAEYMRVLSKGGTAHRTMGQEARRIAEKHSWKKMAAQYAQVLRDQIDSIPSGL